MTKTLRPSGGGAIVVGPTTTVELAERILAASAVLARSLPVGFSGNIALDILLMLHVAEDKAEYPTAISLRLPGVTSSEVTCRWIAALIQDGLVDQNAGVIALSDQGHRKIISILTDIYAAQRDRD